MSTKTDAYLFERDPLESARLDEQHELYNKTLEYLLHPSIAAKLPPNPRIADLASGTGIITRDLSSRFPSASFDVFDISDKQFPKDLRNLPNATFHTGDIKKPVPQQFHGKFDVVYIRHLVIIMEPTDWEVVARNASLFLKPGGAIQWVEGTYASILPPQRANPQATTENLQRMIAILFGILEMDRKRWDYAGLVPIFKNLGLTDVEQDVVDSDRFPEMRKSASVIPVVAACGTLRNSGGYSEEEVAALDKNARSDVDSGAYFRWDIYSTVAWKP